MKLSDKAREKRNAYQRQWRKNNPDKKSSNSEYQKEWRKKNPEKIRQYNAQYWERKAKQHDELDKIDDEIMVLYGDKWKTCRHGRQKINERMKVVNELLLLPAKHPSATQHVCHYCHKVYYPVVSDDDLQFCSEQCILYHEFNIPQFDTSN